MKRYIIQVITCLVIICLVGTVCTESRACSVFGLKGEKHCIAAKNYDWLVDDGLLVVNKRNVKKTAFTYFGQKAEKPATWTSKYGSVTFDQYGCGLPIGGMNEKGLVVEGLILIDGKYPTAEGRPSLPHLQWVLYQLDNYATTAEVVAHAEDLKIRPTVGAPRLHHFVWDRDGNCAVIDWVGGQAVVSTGEAMEIPVMTNTGYSLSLESWKEKRIPEEDKFQSITRFVKAADRIKASAPKSSEEAEKFALQVLDSLDWEIPTMWQIIYDPLHLKVTFRTKAQNALRHVDLTRIDFQCTNPSALLNLNDAGQGDVTEKIGPYSREVNRKLIENALLKTPFIQQAPAAVLDHRSGYPATQHCLEKQE